MWISSTSSAKTGGTGCEIWPTTSRTASTSPSTASAAATTVKAASVLRWHAWPRRSERSVRSPVRSSNSRPVSWRSASGATGDGAPRRHRWPGDDIIFRLMERKQESSSSSSVQRDVRMVSIVRCAGLGKTTLAKQRYIVVVDDIWNQKPWMFIGKALAKTSPGSIIMVTTRVEEVAILSSSSHGGFVYQMKHLDGAHSKRLFFKRFFGCEEKCPPEFEQASKEILQRCDGITLAIISISSFLADRVEQSLYHWNEVKKIMLPGNEHVETMQSVLALSYYNLPHDIRSCLLYLSAFPEDCEIEKDRLVSRWIAEGFINANPGESLYNAGLRYFNVLINRSLIQHGMSTTVRC